MAESSAHAGSARFTSAVSRGLRESAVIALALIALVLLLSLVTYSPEDPGFTRNTDSAVPVHNRVDAD